MHSFCLNIKAYGESMLCFDDFLGNLFAKYQLIDYYFLSTFYDGLKNS